MEQCPISTNENLGPYPEYPKSHSVAPLDDRAIPISFGHEILTRYAILNLADLSHIDHMTVDDSPYLRFLDRTPMDIKSNPVQIAGSTTPRSKLLLQHSTHDLYSKRDHVAQKFQIGISIPDRRVYFQSIPAKIGTKTVSTTISRRKSKSRKTRTKNSENPPKQTRNKEIRARGRHNMAALE